MSETSKTSTVVRGGGGVLPVVDQGPDEPQAIDGTSAAASDNVPGLR